MTDPRDDQGVIAPPDGTGPPGVPRWVKVSGIVVVVLVLVLIAVMLLSGGDHGPRRHAGSQPAGQVGHEFFAGLPTGVLLTPGRR